VLSLIIFASRGFRLRDTLDGYLEFLAAYPHDPMAGRVRAIVAARREALTWRHTRIIDTPQAVLVLPSSIIREART
jgi:hypothetical protein